MVPAAFLEVEYSFDKGMVESCPQHAEVDQRYREKMTNFLINYAENLLACANYIAVVSANPCRTFLNLVVWL